MRDGGSRGDREGEGSGGPEGSDRSDRSEGDADAGPGAAGSATADERVERGPLKGRLRAAARLAGRRRWIVVGVGAGVAVLVAAVSIPLAVSGSGSGSAEPCRQVSPAERALADDPAAATSALDPGEDLARLPRIRELLAHRSVCGDGAGALGAVVNAATRATGPGEPHTMAQARGAYAVATVLRDREIPAGLAPGVARVLAEYVVDAEILDPLNASEANRPAVPAKEARPNREGFSWLGRFLAPGEAHAVFGHTAGGLGTSADIESLVAQLAKDPEAFAILYDAGRAHFAYYLERLTDEAGDPDHRPSTDKRFESTPQDWPDFDLERMAGRIGDLMRFRAQHIRDGTIADAAAFDSAVREHTRGTFRPAVRQLATRPPMGDIADRPTAGRPAGDLMDGRYQLFTVLDTWADARGVSAERRAQLRQSTDDGYVIALASTTY
ncbi:hypothetical protein [Streptomyces tauricus]